GSGHGQDSHCKDGRDEALRAHAPDARAPPCDLEMWRAKPMRKGLRRRLWITAGHRHDLRTYATARQISRSAMCRAARPPSQCQELTELARPRSIRNARCNDRVTTPVPGATVRLSTTTVFSQFSDLRLCTIRPAGSGQTGEVSVLRRRYGVAMTAVLAVMAVLLAACGSSSKGNSNTTSPGGTSPGGTTSSAPAKKNIKVGLAYGVGGRGDKAVNELAPARLGKGRTDLNIQTKELSAVQGENDQQKADRLTLLATSGYNPIVAVGFAYATALGKVAPKYPNVHFAIVDDNSIKLPNVEGLVFSENESSYLVGVAAALATKTKNVGFIGGVQTPLIQKFQAGYQAGVKAINPAIKVQVAYISQAPDFSGFNDPAKGKVIAEGQYDNGAD